MSFESGLARHRLVLEERNTLSVSGVEEVESFDENTIVMLTSLGTLVIHGTQLHIEQLSLEGGELKVTGEVDSLSYEDTRPQGGFFSRLFHP